MSNQKHKRPTKTRAAIDRFLYDLYYQLYDGPRRKVTEILKRHRLHYAIIEDLRKLGAIESTGTGKGQRHRWVGPYPSIELGDKIELLREERRLERIQREKQDQQDESTQVDQLLDLRNQIDRVLQQLGGQSRLF